MDLLRSHRCREMTNSNKYTSLIPEGVRTSAPPASSSVDVEIPSMSSLTHKAGIAIPQLSATITREYDAGITALPTELFVFSTVWTGNDRHTDSQNSRGKTVVTRISRCGNHGLNQPLHSPNKRTLPSFF